MTAPIQIATGAALAALAVLLGAFAAHALQDSLDDYHRAVFETGAHYHLTHALALVLCGVISRDAARPCRGAAIAFLIGVVLFSGSLYLLAVTDLKWLGAITPIGGTAFVVGWVLLARHALGERRRG